MKKMEKNENNKVDFDLLKDFLNKNDIFAAYIGGKIVEIAPGYAKAEMNIEERHLNGAKVVQGGAIFTLADFAFARGANSYGKRATAMSASITYMRPGTGKKLIAEAKEVSCGKKTCLFDVTVCNDEGKKIAKLLINGFLFEGEKLV